jgi:hypothetical protein
VSRRVSRHRRGAIAICPLLLLLGCEPKGGSSTPPVTTGPEEKSDAESAGGNPGGVDLESLTETVGERSGCRSGRIQVPDSDGYLRAVKDDDHGFSVLLPDLADWDMACGDDPYLVAAAMGGAINATVSSFAPPESLSESDYLDLFGAQLEQDLGAKQMTVSDKGVSQTKSGNWVLTFRVIAEVDGAEIWQFNYITARLRSDNSFVTLHIAVTARRDGTDDTTIREFADGLVTYMDLFQVQ